MTHCVKRTKSWQKRCLYLILGRRSCKHVLDMLQFVSKNYNNVKYIKVFHELSLQWNCPSALGLERDSASSMAWVFLLCGPQDWTVVGWTGWVSQGLFSLKRLELCHLERFWFQILSDHQRHHHNSDQLVHEKTWLLFPTAPHILQDLLVPRTAGPLCCPHGLLSKPLMVQPWCP